MENNNIIIRLVKETDIDQINAFHNRIYNDDRTREKFTWEFFDAPAGKAIYVVAEDTGANRIIGTQCAIPIYLKSVDGRLVLSAKSEDTLVDPEYRGMQLFEKMYDFLFDQCKKNGIFYIWGFTPALKPFLKIGFEAPFSHHQGLVVINIMASYNYISGLNPKNKSKEKLKIFGLALLSKFFRLKSGLQSSRLKDIEMKITPRVESNLDQLFLTLDKKYNHLFYIHEDEGYINWRINNNPNNSRLLAFDFFRNDKLIANILFNHHKDNVWYMIQSLFSYNLPGKIKSKLIRVAINELVKTEKASLIRTWNFDTNEFHKAEIGIYQNAGLFYLSRGVLFVWKDLKGNNELLPGNFILSRIATQGII